MDLGGFFHGIGVGLGNFFGGIGHALFGGNDDEEKKRQQQQQQQQQNAQAPRQSSSFNPAAPLSFQGGSQPQQQQQQAIKTINPVELTKATTPQPAQNQPQQPQQVAKPLPQPTASFQAPFKIPGATPPPTNPQQFNPIAIPQPQLLTKAQPQQNSQPQPQPQPQQPDNNPITGLMKFGGNAIGGLFNGAVNSVKLLPDLAIAGFNHLTGNKNMEQAALDQTGQDYGGSLVKAGVDTIKLAPDVGALAASHVNGTPEQQAQMAKNLSEDANSSLLAPVFQTGDALIKYDKSAGAQQAYGLVLDAVKKSNTQIQSDLAAGKITQDQATALIGKNNDALNKVSAVASNATSEFSKLDPQTVAENAANTALAVEGGIKGIQKINARPTAEDVAAAPAREAAPGISSANPSMEADAAAAMQAPTPVPVVDQAVPTKVAPQAPQKVLDQSQYTSLDQLPQTNQPAPELTPAGPNEPAFVRKQVATTQAASDAAAENAKATELGVGPTQLDTQPAFQHKQAIQAVISQGDEELNNFLNEHPEATPQQLDAARESITSQVADKIHQMQQERFGATPEPRPITADVAPAERPTPMPVQALNEAIPQKSAAETTPTKMAPTRASEQIPSFTDESLKPVEQAPTKAVSAPREAPAKAISATKTPQSELPPVNIGNTAKTGEIGKSAGKFSRGQQYEKSSQAASKARGASAATNTDYKSFIEKINKQAGMTGADRDTAVALQQRFKPGSEEHRALGDITNKYHTEAAQTLGTIDNVMRKTADSKQITDRFANKLYRHLGDNRSISDSDFASVQAKNEAFTNARDAKDAAIEKFNRDPSQANTQAVVDAFKNAENADRAAKFEEYKVSSKALKGSKDPAAIQFVRDNEKKAGVYQMDYIDSSMLSSTRVMLNNFLNTIGSRAEESMFGKAGAALARKLTGTDIGGGSFAGARLGAKIGDLRLMKDTELRQKSPGGLLKTAKNVVTTGNSLGDRHMYASAYSGIFDHYKAALKKEGYAGDELKRRALVNSLADPDGVTDSYLNQSFVSNAMASMSGHSAKIESQIADKIAQKTGNSVAAKTAAKLVTRITLGFPTVVARSLAQGTKRTLLGTPSMAMAVKSALIDGDKEATALHIKNAVKEFGSGATMMGIGYQLGQMGLVTGSYPPPSDKEGRAQWTREGKSENSININGSWYQIPQALGVLAIPFMLGANAGNNAHDGKSPMTDIGAQSISTLIDSMPTSSLTDAMDFLNNVKNGDAKAVDKYLATTGAGATKAATPLGSFVGEVAKMFDPTANDTSQGDGWAQFLAKVGSNNPITTNSVPDKLVNGNKIQNPSPLETALGAVSKEQGAGEAETQKMQGQLDAQAKQLSDAGALSDSVRNILPDDATKQIFDQVKSGQKVQAADMKKLVDSITKNVDGTKDTRFLEDGNYDANLAVLKAKQAQLSADPTTPKSVLDQYDTQIKRGQIYKDQQVPYSLAQAYEKTSLTEWRNMGDPTSDAYNPNLYQKLWELDTAFSKEGVSRNSSDPTMDKYSPKAPPKGRKSGYGGSGSAANRAGGTVSPVALGKVTFGNLAPQKVQNATIPVIQQLKGSDLVKKHAISVSRTK